MEPQFLMPGVSLSPDAETTRQQSRKESFDHFLTMIPKSLPRSKRRKAARALARQFTRSNQQ